MTDFLDVDATLEDWNALRAANDFQGLLVGNGASRAVWDDFGYDSLFENARTVEEKPLSPSELAVFDALQTRSFEQVLGALKTTSRVNKALAVSSAAPRNRTGSPPTPPHCVRDGEAPLPTPPRAARARRRNGAPPNRAACPGCPR